jgi:pimeloyl-ACP methyl ester carboxylesterase
VHDVDMVGAPDYLRDGAAARPWGLATIALNYAPRAASADELQFAQQDKADAPDLSRCWMQKAPARQLPNLAKMPMLIVNGEASFHAPFEHCTVKFLEQAGVKPTWIDLGKAGIHGNGHMMMLEKNSLDVAAVIEKWTGERRARQNRRAIARTLFLVHRRRRRGRPLGWLSGE